MAPAEATLEPTVKDPILPCFALGARQRLDHFTGRHEIMRNMDEYFLPPAPTPDSTDAIPTLGAFKKPETLRSFALCGLGGIGNSELAVEYAYSRKDKFEAVFWLGADHAQILASNLAQIAQQLGLEYDSSNIAASRDVAMEWLSKPLRRRSGKDEPANIVDWLIIFDNVDNFDVLSDNWPKFGRGSVLVTSRNAFAKDNLYVENGINVPPLMKLEAETLIQRLTHVEADDSQKEALSVIAQKLDGLPLAINQMSGAFPDLGLSYTDFLNYYNEGGIEALLKKQSELNRQGVTSLTTLWALDRLSKSTWTILQVICLLDPDQIPEELLIDKNSEVKLEHYPKTREDYYNARSELVSSSLINHNAGQISLHRLIQDTAKAMMSGQELIAAFQAAISLISSAWEFQSMKEHHSVARFNKCASVFPSVLRLKNGIEALIQKPGDFPFDIRVAKLFNDTGWYMFERGLLEDTKPFCDLALLIGERLKTKLGQVALESIRESHCFLGIALVETNEHSLSMVHKKKWLEMLEQRRNASNAPIVDYELGYAYNEIGVAYGNNDMLEEAATAFRRSIEIFQSLSDYEDTMLGWPQPNLGFIYWMQGKLGDAEKALVEILDIHAAAWGVDDTKSFKTGKILYGIGNVLEAQGRLDESLNFHRRCFEQFKKVLGPNNHRVGDICHRLAGHFMRQGQYKEAEGYLNSALKIFNSRPYLANERSRTMFRKGNLFRLMGRNEEADKLLREAYAIRRELEPRDTRPMELLEESDFDALVAFWSR